MMGTKNEDENALNQIFFCWTKSMSGGNLDLITIKLGGVALLQQGEMLRLKSFLKISNYLLPTIP